MPFPIHTCSPFSNRYKLTKLCDEGFLLSPDYIACRIYSIMKTNSQNSQYHFRIHHRRQSRRNICGFSLPSFPFIIPCRGEAKWSNSLLMKAHTIQMLLVFISHSSSTQQDTLNQMTSLIFTYTTIPDLLEAGKK